MDAAKEKLLYDTYQTLYDVSFGGILPLDILDEILVEDAMGFGTTVDEKIFAVSGIRELTRRQREQSKGLQMKLIKTPVFHRIAPDENSAVLADDVTMSFTINNKIVEIYVRFSAVFEFRQNKWLVVHFHGSKPENVESEKDTFGIDEWKQKNAALEKLVEEKTADLLIKNRELQIEAALQRVRTVAMSMSKPDDLLNIAQIVFEELQALGFTELRNAIIQTFVDDEKYFNDYDFSDVTGGWISRIPYTGHPIIEKFVANIKKNNDAFVETVIRGKEMEDWLEFRKKNGEVDDPRLYDIQELFYYHYSIGEGDIGISTFSSISAEKLNLLKRFRNVFDLAYQRYTDIQQAEAQAREARIEAALERVRSKAMAMHKSDDLQAAVAAVFDELDKLEVGVLRVGITVLDKSKRTGDVWVTSTDHGAAVQVSGDESFEIHPLLHGAFEAWLKQEDFYYLLEGDDLTQYYKAVRKAQFKLPESQMLSSETGFKRQHYYVAVYNSGGLFAFSDAEFPDHIKKVMRRFAGVFDLTYKRFLDLQKAEAQAKESQIEAALEKVRSSSLAMHHSTELEQVAGSLFNRLAELGLSFDGALIFIFDKEKKSITLWIATNHLSAPVKINLPYDKAVENNTILKDLWHSIETGEHIINRSYSGNEKNEYFRYVAKYNESKIPESVSQLHIEKESWTAHLVAEKNSMIGFDSWSKHPTQDEDFKILIRFAKVFEQAYTRFLDLQKAEAQAREAQIELGLERVRARAMAMQSSEELKELIGTVSIELSKLDLDLNRCFIMIFDPETLGATWWMSNPEQPLDPSGHFVKNHFNSPHVAYIKGWQNRQLRWEYILEGREKKDWDAFLFSETELTQLPPFVIDNMRSVEKVYLYGSFNNFGCLSLASLTPLSSEHFEIMLRFAKVFEMTYTRFNDLQKSEAQAKESQIELGLERVRARAMAMQNSDELKGLIGTLFNELTKLDIMMIGCVIMIFDPQTNSSRWWMVNSEAPSEPLSFFIKYHEHQPYQEFIKGWNEKILQWQYEVKEDMKKEWDKFLFTETELANIPEVIRSGMTKHDKIVLSTSFNNFGCLNIGTVDPLTEKQFDLLLRFAKVFDLTYTRFNDLKLAEAMAAKAEEDLVLLKEEKKRTEEALYHLKATQKQLIQSERLASLGELTAGIAHEIQNPLNFVNNFSEVSNELISELVIEVDKGNREEVKELANDVQQNLSKILHHGKRADAIVKGMLQHSRSGSSQKVLTDINTLADEYLRLSYHGLRAKDKSFNATMETNFEEGLEKINIVPQDIGRVILNLITNAFYAVSEKKKSELGDYMPTVSVSTKKVRNTIEIRVADNGNGIPPKVLNKIFQPFFTTKPTGEGTGLGLSLAYDIIKAHEGELKVETKEGEGSRFTISLPV